MKYKLFLDEVFCWCSDMEWVIEKKCNCILCGKRIKRGDKISLLINNYELFPNCSAHIDCLPDGKVNENILRMLRDEYLAIKKEYDSAVKKARKWGLV